MLSIPLTGRRKIFSQEEVITAENVMRVLNDALAEHLQNMQEEDYLYWYRRGVQPILSRTKEVRPEICNKCVVNNANQVVTFKNGYFLTKPAVYISRREDENTTDKVRQLNEYLYTSGKHQADNAVVNWFHTVGMGVILVEPNRKNDKRKPVNVYAMDPRGAFVVYSLTPGNRPLFGVNMVVSGERVMFDVFTEDSVYKLHGGYVGKLYHPYTVGQPTMTATAVALDSVEPNVIGAVPIIEYAYNENRMGSFEAAVPIMDAINNVESNRMDGIEQFIQSLVVTTNVQFEEGVTANTIRQAGMICLRSSGDQKADFQILSEQLDQTQTQVTLDNLYSQLFDKCGVPATIREGGSTSDNVGAVYLRNGWALADTDARNTEDLFKESNRLFDEVFLRILAKKSNFAINIDDFDLQFTRNDMSNLLVKTQAALNMKELGLAPEICLERSGLSNDPLSDIEISSKYMEAIWNPQSTIVANGQPYTAGEQESTTGEQAQKELDEDRKEASNKVGQHWISGYWR